MQILKFENFNELTTRCVYTEFILGSSNCHDCDHFLLEDSSMNKLCCSHPKEEAPKKLNKIGILKDILTGLHPETDQYPALLQAIKALDNPLGVLPGDKIEVWNGGAESCVSRRLVYYRKEQTYSWITDTGTYKSARIPQINIPVLTHSDIGFLESIIDYKCLDIDGTDKLKEILERKN